MFKESEAFSGFSINDVEATQRFYGETLGMDINPLAGMEEYGMLELHVKNGHNILMYHKDDHAPATFTVLSFPVASIDEAVDELVAEGVTMQRYDHMKQDDKGIARGISDHTGPDVAWFEDPSGNVLSVLQEE